MLMCKIWVRAVFNVMFKGELRSRAYFRIYI
jgi:hypothetical protein